MSDKMLCIKCNNELEDLITPKGINIHPLFGCETCDAIFTMPHQTSRVTECPDLSYREVIRRITGYPKKGGGQNESKHN